MSWFLLADPEALKDIKNSNRSETYIIPDLRESKKELSTAAAHLRKMYLKAMGQHELEVKWKSETNITYKADARILRILKAIFSHARPVRDICVALRVCWVLLDWCQTVNDLPHGDRNPNSLAMCVLMIVIRMCSQRVADSHSLCESRDAVVEMGRVCDVCELCRNKAWRAYENDSTSDCANMCMYVSIKVHPN